MWLLHEKVALELARLHRDRPKADRDRPTAARDGIIAIAGPEAEIVVRGVLMPEYDWYYDEYGPGCTGYDDIIAALAVADADPNVQRITMKIASGGGYADGLYACVRAIEATKKPITARVTCALSAAYALAAACDRIDAMDESSEFGCLGVAVDFRFWADMELVSVVNTESPDKRPDPRTPEGKAIIQQELNQVYAWYAGGIVRGRSAAGAGITLEYVNQNFGRGRVFTANEAQARRMIDGFAAQRSAPLGTQARAASALSAGIGSADIASGIGLGAPSTSNQVTPPANASGEEGSASPSPSNPPGEPDMKAIAKLLGLNESASEESVAAAVQKLQQERDTARTEATTANGKVEKAEAAVARFETALGTKGDAAFGALDGVLASNKQHEADKAKREAEQAEADKKAETEKRAALVEKGKAEGKLTQPLIELYAGKPVVEFEAFLKAAPKVVPASVEQPEASNSDSAGAVLKHNGKTYAELSNAERDALCREDEAKFNQMRDQSLKKR